MALRADGGAPDTGAFPVARRSPPQGARRRRGGRRGPDHGGRRGRRRPRRRPERTALRPGHAVALRRTGGDSADERGVTPVGSAATLVAERQVLLVRTESLVREFHPTLSAGTVILAVIRCRAELLRAGVRHGLARATETRVRARLTRAAAGPPRTTPAEGEDRDRAIASSR